MIDNPSDLSPYRVLMDVYDNEKDYRNLLDLWRKIETLYPQDPSVKANIQKYQALVNMQDSSKGK